MNETQLVKTIKALIERGDHASEKAEQFYTAAGQHLKTLKEQKPEGITWDAYVETHQLGFGRRRADELIQIADGRTTLAKVRADKADSMRQVRERSAPRGAESLDAESWTEDAAPAELESRPKIVDFWDPEKEGHPYPPIARRQGLLNRAADAVRLAQFDDFAGLTVDGEMRKAVMEAVNAWTQTLTKLESSDEAGKAA